MGKHALLQITLAETLTSSRRFIGCLVRKRILVQIYAAISWVMLLLSIIIGSLFLWGLFHTDPTKAYDNCLATANPDGNEETQSLAEEVCKGSTAVLGGVQRAGITIGFVVFWLIMICTSHVLFIWEQRLISHITDACHVIQSYVGQLEEEEDAYGRNRGRSTTPTTTTSVNVMPVVASPLPTTYGQPYPFTQPPNSYGK